MSSVNSSATHSIFVHNFHREAIFSAHSYKLLHSPNSVCEEKRLAFNLVTVKDKRTLHKQYVVYAVVQVRAAHFL